MVSLHTNKTLTKTTIITPPPKKRKGDTVRKY